MKEELDLIKLARGGDESAMQEILKEYKYLVVSIARKYYLMGGDKEDLIQEGMIGLFKAVMSFDEGKTAGFKGYSARIIEREIISAIRRASSNNSMVLSESVLIEDSEIVSGETYPEKDILSEERYRELSEEIYSLLSPMEVEVVKLYLKGYNYIDIANILKKNSKSIDNALSRIKTKLKFLKERL